MANYQGKHVARNQRAMVIAVVAVVAVMVVLAAVLVYQKYWDKNPQPASTSQDSPEPGSNASSASTSQSDPAVDGPKTPPYDFSQPAPEHKAVKNRYFDDAAFVGDSRTEGFMLYSGIGTGDSLTSTGLSIFKLAEKKAIVIDGEEYTLLEALALKEYGKVYISLGINELGYNNDKGFYRNYCAALDEIRRLQPKAVIYVQNLIPLNEERIVEYNGNKYNLTNEHLRGINDLLRQAAEEKQVVYLDLYSEFVNEEGILPAEDSRDGVHLKKEPCKRWLEYLKTHTVDFDVLYPDGPPIPPEPAGLTTDDGSVEG